MSSDLGIRDWLDLTVLDSQYFMEDSHRMRNIAVGTNLRMNIPPQGLYESFFASFEETQQATEGIATAVIGGNSFMSVFITGGLSAVWGLINSLQIIAHLKLLNVIMPANASVLYDIIYNLATFDLPFVSDATDWVKESLTTLGSKEE